MFKQLLNALRLSVSVLILPRRTVTELKSAKLFPLFAIIILFYFPFYVLSDWSKWPKDNTIPVLIILAILLKYLFFAVAGPFLIFTFCRLFNNRSSFKDILLCYTFATFWPFVIKIFIERTTPADSFSMTVKIFLFFFIPFVISITTGIGFYKAVAVNIPAIVLNMIAPLIRSLSLFAFPLMGAVTFTGLFSPIILFALLLIIFFFASMVNSIKIKIFNKITKAITIFFIILTIGIWSMECISRVVFSNPMKSISDIYIDQHKAYFLSWSNKLIVYDLKNRKILKTKKSSFHLHHLTHDKSGNILVLKSGPLNTDKEFFYNINDFNKPIYEIDYKDIYSWGSLGNSFVIDRKKNLFGLFIHGKIIKFAYPGKLAVEVDLSSRKSEVGKSASLCGMDNDKDDRLYVLGCGGVLKIFDSALNPISNIDFSDKTEKSKKLKTHFYDIHTSSKNNLFILSLTVDRERNIYTPTIRKIDANGSLIKEIRMKPIRKKTDWVEITRISTGDNENVYLIRNDIFPAQVLEVGNNGNIIDSFPKATFIDTAVYKTMKFSIDILLDYIFDWDFNRILKYGEKHQKEKNKHRSRTKNSAERTKQL